MWLRELTVIRKEANQWQQDYVLITLQPDSKQQQSLPPEEVGVPQSNTTPCPSRTDTALLVWTLKWSKSDRREKMKRKLTVGCHISGEWKRGWVKAFCKTLTQTHKKAVMKIALLQGPRENKSNWDKWGSETEEFRQTAEPRAWMRYERYAILWKKGTPH